MVSDVELINGCRKNKLNSQEALYKKYYAFGMSVCLRYTRNRDDAAEVLNDSFMKVFKNIQQYDTDRPFKTWFRRILINTSIDFHRAHKKHQITEHAEIFDDSIQTQPEAEMNLNAEDILKLFDQLPDMHRIIFNLYEVEGYSHDEIAGLLDIAPGTSRSHLSRAKKNIAYLYNEQISGGES